MFMKEMILISLLIHTNTKIQQHAPRTHKPVLGGASIDAFPANNLEKSSEQIDVSFLCVCFVIDNEFRHNIVKVVCGSTPRGSWRVLLNFCLCVDQH